MDLLQAIGIGGSFGLAAIGSGIGIALSGTSVIGSWKKCYVQKRPAPFVLVIFAGAALSNVIYGFIVMNALVTSTLDPNLIFILGLVAGIGIGLISITQSKCCAVAAEALAETGQGFGNFLMVVGIAETIGLFTMVFTLLLA